MTEENILEAKDVDYINANINDYDAILVLPNDIITEERLLNYVPKKTALTAYIFNDKSNRFKTGTLVRTSTVQESSKITNGLYLVQTRNTKYALLIKEY